MRKIVVFLLLLSSLGSIAQTYQENLEKYWYFRHRLKEEFMYFSANASSPGSHLPAECRSDTIIPNNQGDDYERHFIRWADGGWWLGHYISVLALEYRLLKDNNQDYNGTLSELIQALNTYDRLDLAIESCFENGSPEWNGFFARDDVPASNDQFFPKSIPNGDLYLTIDSDYNSHCESTTGENTPSQDQIISLFLGLRLVNALVDNPEINAKVREIAGAVIDRMHHAYNLPNPLGVTILVEIWEIKNPVTGNVVPIGGELFELFMQIWAIVEAAGDITTHDEHKFYSDDILTKEAWDNTQNTILMHFEEGNPISIPIVVFVPLLNANITIGNFVYYGKPFNAYMIAVLSTLCDEPGGGYSNTYEWLINFGNDTKGFLGMPDDIGLYPHLPLINRILHGYEGENLIPASEYETKFLNSAPPCGAHHYIYQSDGDTIDEVTAPPWHTISLGCPQHNKGGWLFDGEYNMIDYMILYNSYFLNYLYGDYKPAVVDGYTYPIEEFEVRFDPVPPHYPDTIWIITGTCEEPKSLYASRQIDTKAIILDDGGLNCYAGSSIRLLPGFKVESGGCFKAKIDITMLQDIYYQATDINTCTGGSFGPAESIAEREMPNAFMPPLAFYTVDDSSVNTKTKKTQNTQDKVLQKTADVIKKVNTLVKVFPNPSTGDFSVDATIAVKSIYVFNSFGSVVLSNELVNQKTFNFDLTDHPKGVYYLKVATSMGINTVKIVKL